jgi:hypothetical protein
LLKVSIPFFENTNMSADKPVAERTFKLTLNKKWIVTGPDELRVAVHAIAYIGVAKKTDSDVYRVHLRLLNNYTGGPGYWGLDEAFLHPDEVTNPGLNRLVSKWMSKEEALNLMDDLTS